LLCKSFTPGVVDHSEALMNTTTPAFPIQPLRPSELANAAQSRWLKRATQQRLLCCSGTGYRGDAFLYWLPGREPLLWPGPNASDADKQAWRDRCTAHARSRLEQPGST
jgi:hypothetical protein